MRQGKPTVPIVIFPQPGANALKVADAIHERMTELEKAFPPGLEWSIPYDTTHFVRTSIVEVLITRCWQCRCH